MIFFLLLFIGGKMVIPVGTLYQQLIVIEKQEDGTYLRHDKWQNKKQEEDIKDDWN